MTTPRDTYAQTADNIARDLDRLGDDQPHELIDEPQQGYPQTAGRCPRGAQPPVRPSTGGRATTDRKATT